MAERACGPKYRKRLGAVRATLARALVSSEDRRLRRRVELRARVHGSLASARIARKERPIASTMTVRAEVRRLLDARPRGRLELEVETDGARSDRNPSRILEVTVMRSLFITTSAFIGRIDGDTRCSFWAEEPTEHGFDAARLVSIDLALTPSAAARGEISWDAVQVDDSVMGLNGALSGTTVGPRWPEMHLSGVVLLEATIWRRLASAAHLSCPPAGASGHDYEYQTVVYWPHRSDPRSGRRYAGYHAEILETRGDLARVAIYASGGAGRGAKPAVAWIDLASPDECDAGPDSLTQIGVDGPKKGALFLATASSALSDAADPRGPKVPLGASESAGPKVPPWLGEETIGDPLDPIGGPKLPIALAELGGPKLPSSMGEPSSELPIGLGALQGLDLTRHDR